MTARKDFLLFFGALRRYKGIHTLISAFASVADSRKGIKLLIVGRKADHEYFTELQDLIATHDLKNVVVLIARYIPFEEVATYFEASDMVVLPYEHIYDSGVLRLAFSFGKPVIATRVGIFNELVVDGENGFLVDGESVGLAEGIRRFQRANVEQLEKMGRYSSKVFGDALKWDNIACETLKAYRMVLKGKK